jgi:hypothetical protein
MEYIVPAIKRRLSVWSQRRHDKLIPLIGLVLTTLIPIMICYGIPSLADSLSKTWKKQKQEQFAAENAQFKAEYGALISLCDQDFTTQVATREMPSNSRIVIVENQGRSLLQKEIPQDRQPSGPEETTVVVCLNRDELVLTPQCADGHIPDFTPFIGYEATAVADGTFKGDFVPGDTIFHHPDQTGQVLARYQSKAILYDAKTGKPFRVSDIWGADPPVCSGSQLAGMSTPQTLGGERVTDADLMQWVKSLLGI